MTDGMMNMILPASLALSASTSVSLSTAASTAFSSSTSVSTTSALTSITATTAEDTAVAAASLVTPRMTAGPESNNPDQNYFIAPPPKRPIGLADEPTDFLAEKYVRGFLASIDQYDSLNWVKINSFYWDNRGLCSELQKRCKDDSTAERVSRVAISVSNDFDAGLCVGRLNANFTPEGGSFRYDRGVRLGQFYKRINTPVLNAGLLVSSAVRVGSAFIPLGPVDKEAASQLENVCSAPIRALSVIAVLSMACGFFAACTNLNSDKLLEPESYQKSPIYNYLRHPIASSMMTFSGILSIVDLRNIMISADPSLIKATALAVSSALLIFFGHKKVVALEKGHERFHGKKYADYKKRTPMYVFDLWKLIKNTFK